MTHKKVWFSCDNCGSDTHHETHSGFFDKAKKQAEDLGWAVNTRRAYCPDCKDLMSQPPVKRLAVDLSKAKLVNVQDLLKQYQS